MPIVIGGKRESDFTDPIGMLGDCHQRIVRFLHVLVALATRQKGAVLSEEQRALLTTSLRYFREAAPKHTADEEESLFPRLRQLANPAIDALLDQVDSLEQDHACAEQSHLEVDRLGERWLSNGQLSPAEAAQFETLVTQLEALYRHHIGVEDTQVFPAAARVLPAKDRQAIGEEMARRRGFFGSKSPLSSAVRPQ
jgi:hemerythrin-like domain-containing protein